jgi:hypothetical protein
MFIYCALKNLSPPGVTKHVVDNSAWNIPEASVYSPETCSLTGKVVNPLSEALKGFSVDKYAY